MADKLRSVNTRFWNDSFVEELTPTEKLLFLYLLTNPLTNLLGIYEISLKRISYDTGLTLETVRKGLERFQTARKAFYVDNFIILPNFLKNQSLNPNMKIAVSRSFSELPNHIKDSILGNGSEGLGNGSEGFQMVTEWLGKLKVKVKEEIEEETKAENESDILNIPFSEFWDKYNRKLGDRKKCEKTWSKLKPEEREEIIKFIPKFLPTIKDRQFQPYPETFLNQKRWTNELPESLEAPITSGGMTRIKQELIPLI